MPGTLFHCRLVRAITALLVLGSVVACDDRADKSSASGGNQRNSENAARGEKRGEAKEEKEGKGVKLDDEAARRAGLKVERVELAHYAATIIAFGTVDANRNRLAKVAPPIAGRIARVAVDIGDQVQAGAVLTILESPELAELRTAYQQSMTELELARDSLERSRKLAVDGSIAQKELYRAKADYERARAGLAANQAKLATLKVGSSAPAGESPAFLSVTAPLVGTIIERAAVLGEYAQAYQPLFTTADLSVVWVETNLYDRDLGDVEVGAVATVTVNAYPDQRFTGKVGYIGNVFEKETRTAKARIEVANADGRLKPGMFADVAIEKKSRVTALRVPEEAVVLLQGQMTVFMDSGDDQYEPRPVLLGEQRDGMVVVRSGLEPGEDVVVAGAYALKARLLKSQIGDVD